MLKINTSLNKRNSAAKTTRTELKNKKISPTHPLNTHKFA